MRNYLMAFVLLCTTAANAADLKWAMTTQDGKSVFMNQLAYILYTDGSSTMSIVKTDNSTIEDVTKVSFAKLDATSISSAVVKNGISLLSNVVEANLTITGCKEGQAITVVSTDGAVKVKTVTSGDHTNVDVSRLASGVYMLNVGKTTVKFIKK
ncbi:hypothetical protein CIK99_00355 [Prevotella sp. P5-92]|uniref:T9SS type A sorting domain-containing protein n=1 Tax=Prevotella sp. P5-92 TaxID=2024222 RepID=UPI000BDC8708|nr:T9SS type A sorting domain-containing protein [Prevotella sp. P5-92]OYP60063.1 hypothetical protein CIK99_00355 [Prevotella sp. P5-92]